MIRNPVVAAFFACGLLLSSVASAQLFTASGTAGDGSPDNATANFVFNSSFTSLSVTLANTAGPGQLSHIASLLDGVAFHTSGASLSSFSLTSLSDPNGTVACTSSCIFNPTPVNLATSKWGFNSTTGLLAAGNGSFKPYEIVNSNLTTNGGNGGTSNAQHNPYLDGPVTFNFSIFNPNNSVIRISAVHMYFGTQPDVQTGNTLSPIPEPETYAMLLAGLGLLGFIAARKTPRSAA